MENAYDAWYCIASASVSMPCTFGDSKSLNLESLFKNIEYKNCMRTDDV